MAINIPIISSLGGKVNIFDRFNLEDANAALSHLGLFSEVSNGLANEFGSDFCGWGVIF